ncbi:YgfZ/GcvT domain-containing protein [Casimicrobium huifangae]|uniref:CAF17-like 4Fe-4S cluster assembly/insertion protein YgfZ n=1 Tax=Casimicrobium huifangae TaxID=2591109 RepID=UPI0037836324
MHLLSPEHQVLRFSGPDAQAFLQSQLTNDVDALEPGAWQWQGYCTAKGRLLATFALARTGATEYLAIVHRSLATTTAKRLTMYRLRSKLDITQPDNLAVRLHLAEPATEAGAVATLALGNGRWITIEPISDEAASISSAADAADFMQRWALVGITAMQPEITAATSEHFVPQMIGWDTVAPGGGVSFGKGCYPGQEVVARAHYRGAVKRHVEVVTLSVTDASAGSEVTLADGRSGEICNIARSDDYNSCALLVVTPQTD